MKLPQLVNAVEKNRQHPDTFEIPSSDDLAELMQGDHIKVANRHDPVERFWVQVISVDHQLRQLDGTVDNDLLYTDNHGLTYNDEISLSFDNIYSIYQESNHETH